ncbi:MAG: alkaline phosphatase family protein [Sphingomonas bacterium]|nr:alkaline phosphatase family protein [Sphingomonas bacterium]
MRKLIPLVAALGATSASAQPAPPPKLIVAISVDQLAADLFDEYRPNFTGGLARLAGGTVYRNGYQGHAASETCPGHSTILTGSRPSRTGIIANNWVDQTAPRSDSTIYCAEDERIAGTSSTAYKVSSVHLLVPSLGDRMKAANPASRNVAVSGKDRAAVMMSGHKADQRWYWTGDKFSTDLTTPASPVVARANAVFAAALEAPRAPLDPPAFCQSKARSIAVERSDKPVGNNRLGRNANDLAAYRSSPELDGATLALGAALVDEMKLGKGTATDVLSLGLSSTDYVGHSYGTEGLEMCLQLAELDRELGDFLGFLDKRGIDYVVALTADHGGQDIPERKRLAGVPGAARIDANLTAGKIGIDLSNRLGLPGFGLLGEGAFGDIYLDRTLPATERAKLMAEALAAYRKHPQVEAVFTAEELAATPLPTGPVDRWTMRERARTSFMAGRSGDFVVLLKRDITPIADTSRYIATHGSPWDYDRRVPILFWRKGLAGSNRDQVIETIDIMPTLAAMVGLPVPAAEIDGKCLADVPGATCPGR